jgi:hypothetical protein
MTDRKRAIRAVAVYLMHEEYPGAPAAGANHTTSWWKQAEAILDIVERFIPRGCLEGEAAQQ